MGIKKRNENDGLENLKKFGIGETKIDKIKKVSTKAVEELLFPENKVWIELAEKIKEIIIKDEINNFWILEAKRIASILDFRK